MTVIHLLIAAVLQSIPTDIPANIKADYVQMADSADYYIARENWEDARRCTLGALRADPANFNNALLLSNLGIIESRLGHYDEALESFTLGLNITPRSTTLRTNRARTLLELGRYDEADTDLESLLQGDASNVWARKMHALILMHRNRTEEALAQFRLIDSPDADTLRMMADILQRKGDTDGALATLDRLVETSPSDESYADRALFLLAMGDTAGAAEDIKQGLKVNDKNPLLYLLRAYLRTLMHENTLATEDKKMAIRYGADPQMIERFFPTRGKKK